LLGGGTKSPLRAPQAGFKREIKDIMAKVEARCLEAVWLAVEDFFKRVSEETPA